MALGKQPREANSMKHARFSSALEFMGTRFLVNRMDTMSTFEKRDMARFLRSKAREAWKGRPPILEGEQAIFELKSYFDTSTRANHLPDCDGLAWVAKRILDGAVDAGVIFDDDPKHIVEVRLTAPVHHEDIPYPIRYYGVLWPV